MVMHLGKESRILLSLLHQQCRGRSELAEITGWSRNTVAARMRTLVESGWVTELAPQTAERGRPSIRYAIEPTARLTFVAVFGWDQVHAAICGLDSRIIATAVRSLNHSDASESLDIAAEMLAELRANPAVAGRDVADAVLGARSPIANPNELGEWAPYRSVAEAFSERIGAPSTLENDANLMALGLRHDYPEAKTFIFVKIATGIGAGIVIDGRLHTGLSGLAGEIGHVYVNHGHDIPCSCGNRGCLAQVAAAPAVLNSLSTTQDEPVDLERLSKLVSQGNTAAVSALRTAGRDIGEALAGVVTGLAPDVVVVGGRMTDFGDHLTTGIRESLNRSTVPALSSRLRVVQTSRHRSAGLRGGAELAFSRLVGANSGTDVVAMETDLR